MAEHFTPRSCCSFVRVLLWCQKPLEGFEKGWDVLRWMSLCASTWKFHVEFCASTYCKQGTLECVSQNRPPFDHRFPWTKRNGEIATAAALVEPWLWLQLGWQHWVDEGEKKIRAAGGTRQGRAARVEKGSSICSRTDFLTFETLHF